MIDSHLGLRRIIGLEKRNYGVNAPTEKSLALIRKSQLPNSTNGA